MSKSKIEWTDETWNPVTGCSKVSQGCKNCYAEREWPRLTRLVPSYAGRDFTDVRTHADRLEQPLRWKRPRRIFVNSMSDLFHEDVPREFIWSVFDIMERCPQHTFQILTKRPERMLRETINACNTLCVGWLKNVWLGVSVEDQATSDERIPLLLQTPAAVRWISAEPLLGAIDLNKILVNPDRGFHISALHEQHDDCYFQSDAQLNWVVVGGESGPNARPMSIQWARSLRDQCAAAGVPFLFKQWGEWAPAKVRPSETTGRFAFGDYAYEPDRFVLTNRYPRAFTSFGARAIVERVGRKHAGRLLDGVQHDGYPEIEQ